MWKAVLIKTPGFLLGEKNMYVYMDKTESKQAVRSLGGVSPADEQRVSRRTSPSLSCARDTERESHGKDCESDNALLPGGRA